MMKGYPPTEEMKEGSEWGVIMVASLQNEYVVLFKRRLDSVLYSIMGPSLSFSVAIIADVTDKTRSKNT